MDRRATLALLVGQKATAKTASAVARPPLAGLEPFNGTWTYETAAHLLRRATFGATHAQVKNFATKSLQATLDELFKERSLPKPPINYDATDPLVPIGSAWVDAAYVLDANRQISNMSYRDRSLRAWILEQILDTTSVSVREKMTLFWHNHFALNQIADPKFLYDYSNLLRTYALGNFKDLVKKMNTNAAMLRFLNGNQNTNTAPNENYARELLELFTIGKGPLAGPGDYTNYTETDVKEIARALTGWRDTGYRSTDANVKLGATFRATSHDIRNKTLSARFDSRVITNKLDKEHEEVVDIIFTKTEVARFISRKLYRWFVYYQITAEVEAQVIEPMAQMLISNKYEILPVVKALLGSAHFFDTLNIGPMIKNPIDFSLGALRQIGWNLPTETTAKYRVLYSLFLNFANQQMVYFNPPDVAGWKAYYQEPVFNRIWINATTLQARMNFTNAVSLNGLSLSGVRYYLDVLGFIAALSDPADPNVVIEESVKLLLPQPLAPTQLDYLKQVFIPGLPDYEWSNAYADYLAKPSDRTLRLGVETKLRNLFKAILGLPEFFLS